MSDQNVTPIPASPVPSRLRNSCSCLSYASGTTWPTPTRGAAPTPQALRPALLTRLRTPKARYVQRVQIFAVVASRYCFGLGPLISLQESSLYCVLIAPYLVLVLAIRFDDACRHRLCCRCCRCSCCCCCGSCDSPRTVWTKRSCWTGSATGSRPASPASSKSSAWTRCNRSSRSWKWNR